MIMIMSRIQVGSYYHFKSISPKFFCQSYTNLMSGICIHFTGFKGLVSMETGTTSNLFEIAFCFHKLCFGNSGDAVHTGYILAHFRLHLVCGIFNHIVYCVQGS